MLSVRAKHHRQLLGDLPESGISSQHIRKAIATTHGQKHFAKNTASFWACHRLWAPQPDSEQLHRAVVSWHSELVLPGKIQIVHEHQCGTGVNQKCQHVLERPMVTPSGRSLVQEIEKNRNRTYYGVQACVTAKRQISTPIKHIPSSTILLQTRLNIQVSPLSKVNRNIPGYIL